MFPLFKVFSVPLSTENEHSHLLLANIGIIFQPFSHTKYETNTGKILKKFNNVVNMKEIAFICKCKLVMMSKNEIFKCLFMYVLKWMSNSYDLLI